MAKTRQKPVGTTVGHRKGSGTTLCAARNLGIEAVGIEAERRYCDVAIERLAQTAMPINA